MEAQNFDISCAEGAEQTATNLAGPDY